MPTPEEIAAARRFFGPPASLVMPPTCLAMGRVLLAALCDAEETSLARGRLLDEHRVGCEWATRLDAAKKELDEMHGRLTAAVDRIVEIKEWHGKALEERDAALRERDDARAALAPFAECWRNFKSATIPDKQHPRIDPIVCSFDPWRRAAEVAKEAPRG